ncbi:MAG: hypothetical protein BWX66_01497 [Deltaproteobacteria bacterium ADurb.Bin058]|nr:MAG: hypothetical protein BWX66_01497 [Deltaproteobacteria bacterium ADurb.Bin058]
MLVTTPEMYPKTKAPLGLCPRKATNKGTKAIHCKGKMFQVGNDRKTMQPLRIESGIATHHRVFEAAVLPVDLSVAFGLGRAAAMVPPSLIDS